MGMIRDAWQYYKELKAEEKRKRRLLEKDMDYEYLRYLLQMNGDNPGQLIRIKLVNGTVLEILNERKDERKVDSIDGEYDVTEVY